MHPIHARIKELLKSGCQDYDSIARQVNAEYSKNIVTERDVQRIAGVKRMQTERNYINEWRD